MATLVDTNILLDLVNVRSEWTDWSLLRIRAAALDGPLFINDVIFAELSSRFASVRDVESVISGLELTMRALTPLSLFLAGKAFAVYRREGGSRTNVLPDFFIGAQAFVEGFNLLTRDARRYRNYFPSLPLITPDTFSGTPPPPA